MRLLSTKILFQLILTAFLENLSFYSIETRASLKRKRKDNLSSEASKKRVDACRKFTKFI